MSCPPRTPDPCAQVCPPPPPPPPCINKPVMKGLHWAQTKRNIFTALILSSIAGTCVYFFIGVPRKRAYREYYARGEFEDWADEMARKGLFQAVPPESLKDNQHMEVIRVLIFRGGSQYELRMVLQEHGDYNINQSLKAFIGA